MDGDAGAFRREAWKAEYDATAQTVFTFFDWRHKILVRYALAVAALGLVIRYTLERDLSVLLDVGPFVVGVGLSFFFMQADVVHRTVLDDCYANGTRLEAEIYGADSAFGLFTMMQARVTDPGKRWRSYRALLRALFASGAFLFGLGGFVVVGLSLA